MTAKLSADELAAFLRGSGCTFEMRRHPPCATSEESYETRLAAFKRPIVGAKALVLGAKATSAASTDPPGSQLVLAVLRGQDRLSSSAVRAALRSTLGSVRVSFANTAEIDRRLRGLQSGRVPPFGSPLLAGIDIVLVDSAVVCEGEVGFNAAEFDCSIAMPTKDYLRVLPESTVVAKLAVSSSAPL